MRYGRMSKIAGLIFVFFFFTFVEITATGFSLPIGSDMNHTKAILQGFVITGTVSDTSGPLPGVNITIKGTTQGVATDSDGKFTITVPSKESVLRFSFMGYVPQEIVVGDQKILNITLVEQATAIEEIVVVGYGVQKKQSVVGAISQVNSEELLRTGGVTNISNALTGLAPGLTTLNYSGKPGSDPAEIIIRSRSTWNGSAPLILVDGVEREMNNIDINDVETISILKDASATAVFGVRGGNGVILVTTKRGRESKPVLTLSTNITAKTHSKIPQFLDSYNALWLRNQALENQLGASPSSHWSSYITPVEVLRQYRDQTNPEVYPNVDWQREMLHKWSWSQRYNMDLRGGTKFVKYYAALAYTYDGDILKGQDFGQGYIPKNDYSRYNFRLNLDFQPTSTTTFGVNFEGAQSIERTTNASPSYLWLGVYGKGPDQYPVRYSDGTFANNVAGYNMYNPVEYFNFSGLVKETRTDMNATFTLNQKLDFIIKGLSLRGLANFRNYYIGDGPNIGANRPITKYIDWRTGITTWNIPVSDRTGFEYVPSPSQISTETIKSSGGSVQLYKNLMYQFSLNYAREFGEHNVGAMGVFKRTESSLGQAFPTYREEWAGRATYDYGDRYLFELNAGYNGSEKFIKGKKFGFFPAAALGWVISEEPFFKKSNFDDFINLLKLRYSWGKIGSDNNIPRWLYVTQWSKVNNSAWLGTPIQKSPPYPGYKISTIGNPDARWETAIKNNIALETRLLKNRLSATIDYYWGRRYDIFMGANQRNIPDWFGADPVPSNLGRTSEKGWELETRWNETIGSDFRYYITVMYSNSQNRIEYKEDPELTPKYQKEAGFPIGQRHAYIDNGPISSWDEMYTGVKGKKEPNNFIPGMLQMVDYNGDGVFDENDWVPYGYSGYPRHVMNFTFGMTWKGFSAMIQFYGTTGITLPQSFAVFAQPHYYSVVDQSVVSDLWLPQLNPNGRHRVPVYNLGGDVTNNGTYYLVDGTMWRLKNVEIAYRFSGSFLKKFGIKSLNVFANGNNLWLFSHLNEDRETGGVRENDHIQKYPMPKRCNMGFRVEF